MVLLVTPCIRIDALCSAALTAHVCKGAESLAGKLTRCKELVAHQAGVEDAVGCRSPTGELCDSQKLHVSSAKQGRAWISAVLSKSACGCAALQTIKPARHLIEPSIKRLEHPVLDDVGRRHDAKFNLFAARCTLQAQRPAWQGRRRRKGEWVASMSWGMRIANDAHPSWDVRLCIGVLGEMHSLCALRRMAGRCRCHRCLRLLHASSQPPHLAPHPFCSRCSVLSITIDV